MSSDPNWPSRYSHPTRAAKRANLAEKVAWALKDAQAEIDSLTVLLGQAQKDRDEFARAEDRERTRAECALVALAAAEARAERLAGALRETAPQIEGFCVQAETDSRPPGGQQAGIDRSWAVRTQPSVISELRWYAREFRRLLAALAEEVRR